MKKKILRFGEILRFAQNDRRSSDQSVDSVTDLVKTETREDAVHTGGDLTVAEIAYGALVGVVQVAGIFERAISD